MTEASGPASHRPGEPHTRMPEGRETREVEDHALWQERTRVFLQPIAAPSILGLFGLAGALMMVGAWQAGWYGNAATPVTLFPFVMAFGGLAQFLAAMWSYRARDGLATAVHGTWGSFWLAFGLMFVLLGFGAFPVLLAPAIGVSNPGFGFWFVVLCVITALCAIAALAENLALSAMLWLLTFASAFTAAGFFAGSTWSMRVGGWLFVLAAIAALYVAAALMFEGGFGRSLLPIARNRAETMPGRRRRRPLQYRSGQPGVRIGQ
jgi:uncharacterized protein